MRLGPGQIQKGILLSAGTSVAAIVVVSLIHQSDLSRNAFRQVDLRFFFLGVGAMVGAWWIRAVRTRLLVGAMGGVVALRRLLGFYLASAFVSHVTPGSGGGIPVSMYLLHREGLPWGRVTAYTVLDSFLTSGFLIVLTPVLLIVWQRTLDLRAEFAALVNVLLAVAAVTVGFLIYVILKPGKIGGVLDAITRVGILRRLVSPERLAAVRNRIVGEVTVFSETFRSLVARERWCLVWAGVHTVLYWALYLAVAPLILLGLGVPVDLVRPVLAQLVFNLLQPFIPTPGASGGAELSAAYLFKFFVPGAKLSLFVILWRFVTFYLSLVIGGIAFVRLVHEGTRDLLESRSG